MDKNKLIPLAVIFALLVVGLVVKNATDKPRSIVDQLDLKQFVPEGFLKSDVTKVEFQLGEKKDDKIVLQRTETGWNIRTLYDAVADADKVGELLDNIKKMEGEHRAKGADVFEDFDIATDKALRCVLFGEDDTPIVTLLAGKGSYDSGFVRLKGEEDIYTTPVNLRSEIGMWGESSKPPKQSNWLRKDVLELQKDKVKRVALTWPDKEVAFEKQEKPGPEKDDSKGEEDQPDEAVSDGKPDKPDEAKEKEYEWKLIAGGPVETFKQSGLDSILDALAPVSVSNAVDPAEKSKWGLEKPAYRLEIDLEDGEKQVITAGRPDVAKDAYVMIDGDPVVYKMSSWKFEKLFPSGSDLFELEVPTVEAGDISRVKLDAEPVSIGFVKKNDNWTLEDNPVGLESKTDGVSDIVDTFADCKPADYADNADLGLDKPWATFTFTTKDDKKHTLLLGNEAKATEGRYADIDGAETIFVVKDSDIDKLKPELTSLFDMTALKIERDTVASIEVVHEKAPFKLVKDQKNWQLQVGGETVPADKSKVDNILSTLSSLDATDLLPREDLGETTVVKVTDTNDKVTAMSFGEQGRLRLDGVNLDLKVASYIRKALTPEADFLRKPEPEPNKDKQKPEAPDDKKKAPEAGKAPANKPVEDKEADDNGGGGE